MSRGFPSMTALLGLLAIAGYQNRDKIAEWLGGVGQQSGIGPSPARSQSGGLPGVLEQLRGNLDGGTPGGILSGGLSELIDRFKQNGHGETAESWVRTGPNQPVTPVQLQQAIGPDVLDTLSRQTGLSQQELLARLSRELPDAVDKCTPHGRLPTEGEFTR
jgi:uncharacterized protein YidB (DUF937 family)